MKGIRIFKSFLICAIIIGLSAKNANAQYMPVVYDRSFGQGSYQHMCPVNNGEVLLVGVENSKTTVTKVGRTGDVSYSLNLPTQFAEVNEVVYLNKDQVLLVGAGNVVGKSKKEEGMQGKAVILDNSGKITLNVSIGKTGSSLLSGALLKDGSLFVAGYEFKTGSVKAGMVGKISSAGKIIYKYTSELSGPCTAFNVMGSKVEYIHVAFSGGEGMSASVIRLNNVGKPNFVATLPDAGFAITKMISTLDGYILIAGGSSNVGGRIIKIRPEGDVVFNKEIVPAAKNVTLSHLYLANSGNILVGGSGDDRSYYSLLRTDGTALQTYLMKGTITGMGLNASTGESIIVGFDATRGRGSIIGLTFDGQQIYEKSTDGNYDKINLNANGAFLASTATGRVTMLSNMGEILFDRYAIDGETDSFNDICFTSTGEMLLTGMKNRLVKLAHGMYVSDIKINKPVNGFTTALFTVTLTGYSTTEQGAPVPVSVDYSTKEGTANETNNFVPVKGSLSFVPSNDGASQYMIKQEVEVPIKANNLMEGRKFLEMQLANIKDSYMIKPAGTAQIEDQEVVIKLVNTTDGQEEGRDAVYELGIFKTNGSVLVNATGTDVVVDGAYGKGTADVLDFDMGIVPRVSIAKGASTGKFNVKTLSDTRYELPKSVVVDFNTVHTIIDANAHFEGSLLSCSANIIDQPALLSIGSLGDHGRMNNIVSGFFKISLHRASDGALLTNASGGDIAVACSVSPETTAVEGSDFVLTNMHDLRIWGDGNRSAVNLNGIVLYDKAKQGAKRVAISLDSVKVPDGAPAVNIASDGKSAGFTVK